MKKLGFIGLGNIAEQAGGLLVNILLSVCLFIGAQSNMLGAESPGTTTTSAWDLSYVIRGEVRFLLFWFGRDNVGGGRISISRGSENNAGLLWEEVEVLFGSNPERVPGKVNLWGYGKERSLWKSGRQELIQSVFEGFMRPTDDLPANMKDYLREHKDEGSFLYKAINSEVNEKAATTEIRFFVEKESFNYRSPEALLRKYRQTLRSLPPDIRRELSRLKGQYEIPAGFLTAARSLIGQICGLAAANPRGWVELHPNVRYAFHAKPYRLSVKKINTVKSFAAPAAGIALQNVAEVAFRIENLKDGLNYDFTLWFATDGPLQGLPLRIAYQPKWWLRLRLDLTEKYLVGNPG